MRARCRALRLGAITLGALMLAGCGQMGPLVLPGAAAQAAEGESDATGDATATGAGSGSEAGSEAESERESGTTGENEGGEE